ncbi:sprt family metallopeptidase [Purpureocillium lavendulum]|uniref:Sprt family metallopeptidase n=1 Tax=Purpureocillium lavendulum TaxID=1247861 RepID=A0AB34FNJ3_9HYPO|nr:sprt family metallopeptidase [Purpureocillium lavendulum]
MATRPDLSYAMREDLPPPTARASRTRRQLVDRLLDGEADESLRANSTTLLTRADEGQHNYDGPMDQASRRSTAKDGTDAFETTASTTRSPPLSLSPCNAHEEDPIAVSEEEPSIYETAVEHSQSESERESSDSEFELSDSSENVFGSPVAHGLLRIAGTRNNRKATKLNDESRSALDLRSPNIRTPMATSSPGSDVCAKIAGSDVRAVDGQSRRGKHNGSSLLNGKEAADSLDGLRRELNVFLDDENDTRIDAGDKPMSPPSTPPRTMKTKGLVSPRKRAAIPSTPHRPSVDAFWNRDFVDDWNEQHSPQKVAAPRPALSSLGKKPPGKAAEKKSFDARKLSLAEDFLHELDVKIAEGKISDLAESTGGVKLVWTKTLNTTAGRANWKRETIRTKQADGTVVKVAHKHHASIELAEKVIDDDDKLLNVLAHEFCHLANFMITGITNNPHGKEFKVWAAKCSREFGKTRGIQVTTKHTYDIDFKYSWQCSSCGSEYKRHSRSINPHRHRCGSCKGALTQTKPCPRRTNVGGGQAGRPTEYQMFVREQMKIVRGENPSSPQKEVMRIVADKWATAKKNLTATDKVAEESEIDLVAARMVDLTVDSQEDDRA